MKQKNTARPLQDGEIGPLTQTPRGASIIKFPQWRARPAEEEVVAEGAPKAITGAKKNRYKGWITNSVLGAVLAIAAFALAPSMDEQSAMRRRDIVERAQTYHDQGDIGTGVLLLEQGVVDEGGDPLIVRTLMRYYSETGRYEDHYRLVRGQSGRRLSTADLRAASSLYEQQGMTNERLWVLSTLSSRNEASTDELVVLGQSYAQAGDANRAAELARDVVARLGPGENAPAATFAIDALAQAGEAAAVTRFGTRWLGDNIDLKSVVEIAPALIRTGNAELAAVALRSRQLESQEARDTYVHALRMASSVNPEIRRELTRETLEALPNLPAGVQRDVALHDLFAFGDIDLAISELRESGEWRAEPMRSAFVYSLIQMGRTQALRDTLIEEIGRYDTSVEERRATSRQLADLGFVGDAQNVLQRVVEAQGPNSASLGDLFYLWKAHNHPVDMAWLAAQTRGTHGTPTEWVEKIEEGVSPAAAVATVDAVSAGVQAPVRAELVTMKVRYLAWGGDSPVLRQALSDATREQLNAAQAGEVGNVACLMEVSAVTYNLAPRAAGSAHGVDLVACATRLRLAAAHASLQRGDLDGALANFAAAALTPDHLSSQDFFDYALALESASRTEEANAAFQLALSRMPPANDGDAGAAMTRAAILTRMHREEDAIMVLEAALVSNPNNNRVRITLAELLLGEGKYQRALDVATPGNTPSIVTAAR